MVTRDGPESRSVECQRDERSCGDACTMGTTDRAAESTSFLKICRATPNFLQDTTDYTGHRDSLTTHHVDEKGIRDNEFHTNRWVSQTV